MNGAGLAALLSAWLLGSLIVAALWPRERGWRADGALILPLGMLVGLGATSVIFFAASLVSNRPAGLGGALELVAQIGLIGWLARRARATPSPGSEPAPSPSWLQWALATVFLQAWTVSTVVVARMYRTEPYGGWDAWAIWNLHARGMVRAGTGWADLLAAPQLSWTHPDYPKLVPASVARVWSWAGTESASGAALVSVAFAVAIVGLLVAAVRRMRGRTPALLGGLLLLGTPFFLTFAPNEHADIPLAAFMLATIVLASLGEHWVLAGVCAGLAAWTKNEGLLFAVVVVLAFGARAWWQRERGNALRFLGGFALGLLPVIAFKLLLAPPGDLLAMPLGPRLAQLIDGERHRLILASLWRDLGGFGEWRVMPYVAMALPFFAWRSRRGLVGAERSIFAIVGLMLAGYYGVYLLSPQDLKWHLDSSLVRLLLQVWPLVLFGWCLMVPADLPVELPARAPRRCWTLLVFLVVNLVAAIGVVGALNGQYTANELAVKQERHARLSVTLGDGWHGIERQGTARWAWSNGDATLLVQVNASGQGVPAALRFDLRSLAPRQVTIRADGAVVWSGAVPDGVVPVRLPARTFPDGTTVLSFSTDTPGVPEGASVGGRSLVFALYDVRVK